MQEKYEIVIADTTCFILLENIGELNLLKSLSQHNYNRKGIWFPFAGLD